MPIEIGLARLGVLSNSIVRADRVRLSEGLGATGESICGSVLAGAAVLLRGPRIGWGIPAAAGCLTGEAEGIGFPCPMETGLAPVGTAGPGCGIGLF